jgi:hypothetical protein
VAHHELRLAVEFLLDRAIVVHHFEEELRGVESIT